MRGLGQERGFTQRAQRGEKDFHNAGNYTLLVLLTLIFNRIGNGSTAMGLSMDSLSYHYNLDANGNLLNNQLNYIHDAVGNSNGYTTDLKSQSPNNYTYDSIGNLISDVQEGITNITWNVYGKITSITKTSDTTITYSYDAAGNRISKTVSPPSGAAVTTWYVRDASGNVMAVYYNTDSLRMTEQHIYGSSRLGILNTSINVQRVPVANTIIFNYRGFRNYELANHLGNVLVTITDKKMGVPSAGNSSLIDHFNADVASANDYYPFGMLMPGRGLSAANAYRYGFNGKEKSDEVNGSGVDYDYGMRVYDARIGRFLSVDPLTRNYPANTPYEYAENDVIRNIDLDGLEKVIYLINKVNSRIYITQMQLETAGPLGDGVAVRYLNRGTIHSFYGKEIGTAKDFAKSYEGTGIAGHPFERYNDQYGFATIGYGHLMDADDKKKYPNTASIKPLKVGSKIEKDAAESLFTIDYNKKVAETIESLKLTTYEGGELEAFTDFSYNIKNARQRIQSFKQEQGGMFFLDYMKGGPGLEKRRIAEYLMFENGSHIMFELLKGKSEKTLEKTIIKNTPFSGGGDESHNLNNTTS